jgi:hypothetical protein
MLSAVSSSDRSLSRNVSKHARVFHDDHMPKASPSFENPLLAFFFICRENVAQVVIELENRQNINKSHFLCASLTFIPSSRFPTISLYL